MKKEAFSLLHEAERSWWYRGRAHAIHALFARVRVRLSKKPILDFGAGHGGMFDDLARLGDPVYGFEPDAGARKNASLRRYEHVFPSPGEALSRQYGLICLFDVLEHIEADRDFLLSLHMSLLPGGLIAITVPAFSFLWSEHDMTHHHFRRYNRGGLARLLDEAGYDTVAMSYWNMALFLPAALIRLSGRSGASSLALPRPLDVALSLLLLAESWVLRHIPLPFGTGIVAIARRKEKPLVHD